MDRPGPENQSAPPPLPPVVHTTLGQKIWTFVRIANVRLRFILLMVIVGVVVGKWETIANYYDRWTRPKEITAVAPGEQVEYYCAMHPNIVREQPGKCPICGMPLVQRKKTGAHPALPPGVLAEVQLTPLKVQRGRIGTSPVEYRMLSREVRTVGIVDYDETLRSFISARIKGRVDKLLVNYVGQKVKKGDPLVEIYSPDLVVAQEELLTAVRALKDQKDPAGPAAVAAQAVVEASRRKLLLWGITREQVEEIIARGSPQTSVAVHSPITGIVTEKKVLEGHYVAEGEDLYTVADLGRVWLQAKVFERDIQGISEGTAVEVSTTAYPNDTFAGRITFIAYTVDPDTRTVSARVEVDNPEYKLKPGMFATAVIRLPLGKVTEFDSPAAATLAASAPPDLAMAAMTAPARVSTDSLVHAYLALSAAYAQDRIDTAALTNFVHEAQVLSGQLPPAQKVFAQVRELQGKNLEAQRETFKAVSQAMIDLLQLAPASHPLFIAHCPMAKADWISAGKEIVNPYKGTEMLDCGGITGPLEPVAPRAAKDAERFALGYYCPLLPDRLFSKPEECPLDKLTKFARVEKVLAVPESAVIDTGNRKIVYRETTPGSGTFDMLEVKLGARAGEFFPVVDGFNAGDQVATQGAFLVDAENRLNPAAGAQFFGASGGPTPSGEKPEGTNPGVGNPGDKNPGGHQH